MHVFRASGKVGQPNRSSLVIKVLTYGQPNRSSHVIKVLTYVKNPKGDFAFVEIIVLSL